VHSLGLTKNLSIQSAETTVSNELVPERLYSQINIKVFNPSEQVATYLSPVKMCAVGIKMFDHT